MCDSALEKPRLQADKNDVLLPVRVKPRARANTIEGVRGESLLVNVSAAPSDGEANAAVIEVLARSLKLPKSRVSIARGTTARDKTIRLHEMSISDAQMRLDSCL